LHEQFGSAPELELLLTCARWPQRESDRLLIVQLAGKMVDWDKFVTLTRHHRIVPLVSRNLRTALPSSPPGPAQLAILELQREAAAATLRCLQLLGELRRVIGALRDAGVSVRVIKGFPLAQLVFGDVGLRSPGDLDLLVDDRQLIEVDRIVRELGYTGLFEPQRFTPRQLLFYRAHWKDVTYTHHAIGNELDVHWRCFRNPEMQGGDLCSAGTSETVTFGDLRLDTMARQEGLLYLCVHGALDGWIYLKFLADVAAQVREMSESEIDALAELARGYGVLPELTAALILVRRLFCMDNWSSRLLPQTDRAVRHILRYVNQTLNAREFMASREQIPIGTTLRFEWGLRRGFAYRVELLTRVLYRARMWETIPLPDWLFWAYPLLSPGEWILFRLRRRRAADRAEFGPKNV